MERFAVYDGAGIGFDQGTGGIDADDCARGIAAFAEDRRAAVWAMRVGGEDVNAVVSQKSFGASNSPEQTLTRMYGMRRLLAGRQIPTSMQKLGKRS